MSKKKSAFEILSVLSYDEVTVSSATEYEQKNEIVIRYSYIQVSMVRDLFGI